MRDLRRTTFGRATRRAVVGLTIAVVAALAPEVALAATVGPQVAPGFEDSVALAGLTAPTNVEFAADGRVVITEKRGLVKIFANLSSPTPTVVADLRTEVDNYWDRGLLGLAIDPAFTTGRPYLYVSYTYDHILGDPAPAPKWGTPGADSDSCADPMGTTTNGCVVSGRVSRLTLSGNQVTAEKVLVEDWCAQFPSHSVGDLRFGGNGALYASGGDGANFNSADIGNAGKPGNGCGDPTGEGGALRAQDLVTPADPTSLDGSIIAINPDTGAAWPTNPYAASGDPNKARIIAEGLRNPFRFTFRPGSDELYVGDVGWGTTEEINRVLDPTAASNFGWPCYEGSDPQPAFMNLNTSICTSLYADPTAVTTPFFQYRHTDPVVPDDGCVVGNSSPTGIAFAPTAAADTTFPARYRGAMFFTDYSRKCIWAMLPGAGGRPDPATTELFLSGADGPVDLSVGPGGDLFYLELNGGTLHRVTYSTGNHPPTATASASVPVGAVPLTTTLTATGTDPDAGDTLTYAWDLNGDGVYETPGRSVTTTYPTAGVFTPKVEVRDAAGATAVATAVVSASATLLAPPAPGAWQMNGSANLASAACLELTPTTPYRSGSAWLTTPVTSSSITASFDAVISDGTGADGLTLAMIDASSNGSGALGEPGSAEGFGGLGGVAVSLDTFQAGNDPSANFVGIATGGSAAAGLTYVATSPSVPTLRDATTHVDVIVTNGRLQVFVAGAKALDTAVTLPPTVLLGFTAGSGSITDRHQVCNVAMAQPPLTPGRLSVTPGFMDFGQIEVGRDTSADITLTNTGQTALTVGTETLPTGSFQATAVLPAGATLAPGASVVQPVRFRPGSATSFAGTFTIGAGGDPATSVSLVGVGLPQTGPAAVITTPLSNATWTANGTVGFSGGATRADGSAVPASALTWSIILHHCSAPTVCHTHPITDIVGVGSGSFAAPDHEFPSYLELKLAATDGGVTATDSVRIDPATTPVALATSPPGLKVVVGSGAAVAAPTSVVGITGGALALGTATDQVVGGVTYRFRGWSDGGAATHEVPLTGQPLALTATFTPVSGDPARCGTSSLPPLSDAAAWNLNGSASRIGPEVVVTPANPFASGSVVSNAVVPSAGLQVCADLSAGGGTGADGIAIALLDPASGAGALGAPGGSLGYVGIGTTGVAVALDTYPGPDGPVTDFIGVLAPTGGYAATAAITDGATGGVPVGVRVEGGSLVVTVGGSEVLRTPVTLPPQVRVAVTAANGTLTDQHSVANLVVIPVPTVPPTTAPPTTVPPTTVPPAAPAPAVVPAPVVTGPSPLQIWLFLVLWRQAIDAQAAAARRVCRVVKVGRTRRTVCTVVRKPAPKKK